MSPSLARSSNGGRAVLDTPAPWTPFNDMLGFDPFQLLRSGYGFEYDVTRTENGYAVDVPVAGYAAEQIEVTVKDNILTIAGKTERRSFTRSLSIPDDVNVDAIDAEVKNGMLHLTLQRHPQTQPKKINVKKVDPQ